jgi:hypothetical protein
MRLNKTYSTIRTDRDSSDAHPLQNGLKQEHALLPVFGLEYTVSKVQ